MVAAKFGFVWRNMIAGGALTRNLWLRRKASARVNLPHGDAGAVEQRALEFPPSKISVLSDHPYRSNADSHCVIVSTPRGGGCIEVIHLGALVFSRFPLLQPARVPANSCDFVVVQNQGCSTMFNDQLGWYAVNGCSPPLHTLAICGHHRTSC